MSRVRYTFQQLRIFDAVVRAGTVSGAAEALAVTQPTVSASLKELTDAVGLSLIAGYGKAFALTQAGERVAASARAQLLEAERLKDELDQLKGLSAGRLRIAAVTTTEYFLPALVGPFADAHPGLQLSLTVENRDRIVARLTERLDDIAVMMYPPDDIAINVLPFLDNPLVAIAPVRHPFVGRSPSLRTFVASPFLLREPGSGTRRAIEEHCERAGVSMTVRMQLGSNEAIKHAVAAGLGVSILSAHSLSPEPQREGLAVVAVRGLPIRRQWSVVSIPGSERNPAVAAFLSHLRGRR
jgi:LysR family transcriptional regulator, low CO2-responsive transcriptional regulator